MTSSQVNAELFRNMAIIAEDEDLMSRALKAIKRPASAILTHCRATVPGNGHA